MGTGWWLGWSGVVCAALSGAAWADELEAAAGPDGSAMGDGARPLGGADPVAKSARAASRTVRLAELDTTPLRAEDRQDGDFGAKAQRTGVVRSLGVIHAPRRLVAGMRGVATAADGSLTWSVEIVSPAAQALRVHVSALALPPGATLVVYDADDPSESYGPWTGAGPDGSGAFWTPNVFADRVRLEIRVPASAAGLPLRFAARRVLHGYDLVAAPGAPVVATKSAQLCENDVACDPTYATSVSHGVARLDYVKDGAGWRCTGALLNDSDTATRIPWLLTAAHCISTEEEARSVVCLWDFFAACGESAPSLASLPQTAGATLVVTYGRSDVTLLRLTGSLPAGRMMLGWTSAVPAPGAEVACVHHPAGDTMKVSYGAVQVSGDSFHDVLWSRGVTEKGSSGAPLLNASRQVVGQLWGGSSSCDTAGGIDGFGRFDVSYALLRPYLWGGDPLPPPPETPVTSAVELSLGTWAAEYLNGGSSARWNIDLVAPEGTEAPRRLRVQIRGSRDAWAELTHPDGTISLHRRGRSRVLDPQAGRWSIALHAAEDDTARWLRVRVSPSW